jgi:hypothetical protein
MPNDKLHATMGWTVIKKAHGWFVVLPDETTELGPYLKGSLAMQVALAFVRPARRQGLDAHVFVGNDRGQIHNCQMINGWNSSDPCHACSPPRQKGFCPLHAEMLAARKQPVASL